MYIWIGLDVDSQLQDLKTAALRIEEMIGFHSSCLSFPSHISLKMPFFVDMDSEPAVIAAIDEYLQTVTTFDLPIRGFEKYDGIVWLRLEENELLIHIQDGLNDMLEERFGIGLHDYDQDHQFHVTLFMDDDTDKINQAYSQIKTLHFQDVMLANQFSIRTSTTGLPGTFTGIIK